MMKIDDCRPFGFRYMSLSKSVDKCGLLYHNLKAINQEKGIDSLVTLKTVRSFSKQF